MSEGHPVAIEEAPEMSIHVDLQLFTGGDRFTTVTPDDHGGILWVASIICAIYVVLSMGLRAYVKREFYGLDDLIAFFATVRQPPGYIFCYTTIPLNNHEPYTNTVFVSADC